jgi:glycosyltransferase involved in cell wall biosynthesis
MQIVAYPAYWNRALNPYNALLYESMTPLVGRISEYAPLGAMPAGVDVFHVHWPDRVMIGGSFPRRLARSLVFLARLAWAKAGGTKVVWTVHNLKPHEPASFAISAFFWPIFIRLLNGAIYLSEASRVLAHNYHPALRTKRSAVIPHGHYRPMIASAGGLPDRRTARDALELPRDGFVFLYFGQIRDYKNLPRLIDAFAALSRPEVTLLIVGSTVEGGLLAEECRQAAGGNLNIRFDFRHVPDEMLLKYLAASNMAILPYREVLNSGSVLMALSANRPVVAPKSGSIAEIANEVGTAWMHCYDGDFTESVLLDAIEMHAPESAGPDLTSYDWQSIAQKTTEFYRSL